MVTERNRAVLMLLAAFERFFRRLRKTLGRESFAIKRGA